MYSLKSEKLPKMERPKVNSEDLIKKMGGINVSINVNLSPDNSEKNIDTIKSKELDSIKKTESINAEMLKIMKKEKEPIFEQGKELKAEKYIF